MRPLTEKLEFSNFPRWKKKLRNFLTGFVSLWLLSHMKHLSFSGAASVPGLCHLTSTDAGAGAKPSNNPSSTYKKGWARKGHQGQDHCIALRLTCLWWVLRPLEIPTNLFTLFFFLTLWDTYYLFHASWNVKVFVNCWYPEVWSLLLKDVENLVSFVLWVFFYFIKENSVQSKTRILILGFIIIMQNTLSTSTWNECFWGKKPLLLLLLLLICRDVSKC